ncbi:MAG TPA: ATP-binding cassette domain-containing protein [Candidatus Anaerotruncus excrementipullorum]|uniref:ATP-binding cassette domain-containing protein n=1 Tax=Candidatus Anaerotruncus excrementipullorum TaxID=2838465 RepID=A0A9D1WSX2_9FIRM|nr:ATP-binding cassette domain-containing protein [Candidatus Anaerotruncus excrementipullorum]
MEYNETPALRVRHLTVRYGPGCDSCRRGEGMEKNRCPRCGTVWSVRDVSLEVYDGEILGLVGESGSGKSTLLQSLYFQRPVTEGEVFLQSYREGRQNILAVDRQQQRRIKDLEMAMVYQNPVMGLRMEFSSVGNIAEKLLAAGSRNTGAMVRRAQELLETVEIPLSRMKEPPKNFSGGMQQRVQISKALANNPTILLLDEITTGLDLSVQARVLDLLRKIKNTYRHVSMLLVSHDLSVIRMLADRTLVMYDGQVVENGLTDQILEDPQHPFTQQLVHSLL